MMERRFVIQWRYQYGKDLPKSQSLGTGTERISCSAAFIGVGGTGIEAARCQLQYADGRGGGYPPGYAIASTVEKLDPNRHYEVAVVDECQMIADDARGFAWTRVVCAAVRRKSICAQRRKGSIS